MSGGFFGSLFNLIGAATPSGQNKNVVTPFGPNAANSGYDANAANYGGSPTGLQDYQSKLSLDQGKTDGRDAFRADSVSGNNDYQHGLAARGQSQDARTSEANSAQKLADRANGVTPTVSSMQAQQDMQRAQASQTAQAASARGAGGMALAQQNAANNTANTQSAISGQAQVNSANEVNQAQQAATNAYGNIRQGDLATRQGDQAAQAQNVQQAEVNAQLAEQNRQINDARSMGDANLAGHANDSAMQGQLQGQGILANSYNAAQGYNNQNSQNNANRSGEQSDKMYQSAGDMFDNGVTGAAMLSDTRAKKQAILNEGRKQGASGQPIDIGDIDGPSTSDMLDDRQAQGSPAAKDVMDPATFQQALAGQVQGDRAALGQDVAENYRKATSPQSETDAKAQWERMNGSAADAKNQVGAMDTMKHFAPSGPANAGSPMRGFFGMLGSQPQMPAQGPQMSSAQRLMLALGGGQGGGNTMVSDERAKQAAFMAGIAHASAGGAGGADYERMGHAQRMYAGQVDEGAEAAASRIPSRDQQPERMSRGMRQYVQGQEADDAALASGQPVTDPETGAVISQSPIAESNRSMAGSPYAYKDGMTPPGQKPGEVNVGPMAQNLESNPVAATAVKTDPRTGLKMIDKDKALKVTMAGLADLQKQQDQTRAVLNAGGLPKKKAAK